MGVIDNDRRCPDLLNESIRYNLPVDLTLGMLNACAERDIGTLFRLLADSGVPQRRIGELVSMSQSEVSEILSGRKVMGYAVLERISEGLGIPRGLMGLAYDEATTEPVGEEVDEEVERRKLLALAGAILCGAPVFGQPESLSVRRVLTNPPQRIGVSDLNMYEATMLRLQALQRQVGGRATREPLAATAKAGEELLKAEATPDVHQRLRFLVSDVHRRAGWAAGDSGLVDDYRAHMHAALDFAAGDSDRVALVLQTAGAMEKSLGHSEFALKLLQMGQVAANTSTDPQVRGVIGGETVDGYVASGRTDMARKELKTARFLFADADITQSLPGFASYGNGHGVLASAELRLGNFAAARSEILTALQKRPKYDHWCNALDTIILATTDMRAGEVREAVHDTQKALKLVSQVGSWQLGERLVPLAVELEKRKDSTCQDLARVVRAVSINSEHTGR
jgi:transcriptional regulator with XRE-family HTH domain